MNRIKKNDTVYVVAGKDKGKTGRVLKVFYVKNRAIVEGINLCKKHMRQTKQDRPGGVIEKENSINMSSIMPYCTKCKRGARISYNILEDKSKVKICKRCKEVI